MPDDADKPKRAEPQRLSSVTTAMRLLKTFSEGEVEIGVTSLAKRLGVAKSTVYRLASTLVAEGLLEQNKENDKYRLGIALFGLGLYLYRGQDLPQAEPAPDPMQLHLEAVANNMASIQYIKEALAKEDYLDAYAGFMEISEEDRALLWMAPTKGGKAWTTKEIAQFKSNEWGAARKAFNGIEETA